jgi:hypothetical protein
MSTESSTVLLKALDSSYEIPPCRWCGYVPRRSGRGRPIVLQRSGLPSRCPNRNCRSTTAYLSDAEIRSIKRRQYSNLGNRWKGHIPLKHSRKVKEKPNYYVCLKCERVYENERHLQAHKERRGH